MHGLTVIYADCTHCGAPPEKQVTVHTPPAMGKNEVSARQSSPRKWCCEYNEWLWNELAPRVFKMAPTRYPSLIISKEKLKK